MGAYILRRLALMVPTLIGIMALNFFVIQAVPGGPVEQILAEIDGSAVSAVGRISGDLGEEVAVSGEDASRGARGLDPEFVAELRA
ncbi:MAG: microcin ABC transporter permease, partial [Pseudomonadota bacterium]